MENPPPPDSVNLHPTNAIESSLSAGDSPLPPPPTQTLDHYFHRQKAEDHARARMLFDEIAEPPPESQHDGGEEEEDEDEEEEETEISTSSESEHEEGEIEPLESSESPEVFKELLLSPFAAGDNVISQPSSHLVVDNCISDHEDDIKEWISRNRSEYEDDKSLLLIASDSSSWYYDLEKPAMVGAGLANMGNTCFLNAVLQCFTHTVMLIQGLNSYTACDCNGDRFCLFCVLCEHINHSLSSGKIVFPEKFVDNLSYFSSSFQRYQQEDAHEFLQCFLDRLESSFSNLKAKDVAFTSQNDNLVKQVFGGRVVSKLRCCNCNHSSDTYEPSVDLSLEIEDAYDLSMALESFTKVEHIEDEEMKFTCENCNQKVSVEKQLMLDQIPPVCALHLKRFKNDGSYVEKIDKHVEFPLELDLQPYTCSGWASNVDLKYELYAVVVHSAFSSTCGHYYCYIRSAPGTWYKFDDSKVIRVSEEHVLLEEAYILFYTKQGTPWFSNFFMKTYNPSLGPTLSNTSPKSVLDNVDHTSPKSEDRIFPESSNRSSENQAEGSGAEDHHRQSYTTVPLGPSDSAPALNEYSSNHRLEVQMNASVEAADLKDHQNGVYSKRFSGSTFDIEEILSPSTPPRSPGIDGSDDESSEVVFAPKPDQLKFVEKTSTKRQRTKNDDNPAKLEALKQCKKMPSSRARLLMAAIDAPSKSEAPLNKRSKKTPSSSTKNIGSSDRFERNLATSSFR